MPTQLDSTQRTVQYTRGDHAIAYEVVGDGALDVVLVPGFASHLDAAWDEPGLAEFQRRIGDHARLILYDRRGQGLTDRTLTAPTLEENVADLRLVLDAVGSRRTVVLGVSQGGPTAIAFAAAEPARTAGLVLYGSYARAGAADDYPIGPTPDQVRGFADVMADGWGGDDAVAWFAPSRAEDDAFRQWFARSTRSALSPGGARAMLAARADLDVRDVLQSITAPTLVIHRTGDRLSPVEHGRYLAEHIRAARYRELAGDDHLWWVPDPAEIAGLVTGLVAELEEGRP
jgi:pimeloyl-ACP methyl ester carboxylesterase